MDRFSRSSFFWWTGRAAALVLAAAYLAWARPSCASPSTEPADPAVAQISVQLDRPSRVIPGELFGSNLQWEYNGDLILGIGDTVKDGYQPAGIIDAVRSAGITTLRFPGGTLSDTYQWKFGIGPRAQRPQGLSFTGKKIPSNFGTDELIQLCRTAKLTPILTVNFSSSPEDAADWVEYMNGGRNTTWGAKRAANGSPEPLPVVYWEIGNEIYSPNEPGHVSAKEYGKKFRQFAAAMRKRSPNIKLGATLDVAFLQAAWMPLVIPHMKTWNEEVLQECGPEVDFAVVHWYAPFDKVPGDHDLPRLIWSSSDVLRENLGRIGALLDAHAKKGAQIALTEYNTAFNDKGTLDQRIASTETAIHDALILIEAMREPRLALANNWSLLNDNVFGIFDTTSGALRKRPTFEVFRDLSAFAGKQLVPLQTGGASYAVSAKGNIPERPRVGLIQGAAAVGSRGEKLVALVNRSPMRPVKVTLTFSGGQAPRALSGRLLAAPIAAQPALDWPPARQLSLNAGPQGAFTVEMPPRSLTVLEARSP